MNPESGILKATSNGLPQQSFARRAETKVSCISNILPSVLLCTTLKRNEQFSGNSVWVEQRQRRNPYIKWICYLSCLTICIYLFSTLHSLPVTIGNFTNSVASKVIKKVLNGVFKQNIPSWSSRMERQLDEQDSTEKLISGF